MPVRAERAGGGAYVTVDRPDALNALDLEHAEALHALLGELARDEDVRVVVLAGAGDRAFVAGADIKYMRTLGVLEARRWAELGQACANLLEQMPKPTVAAINGWALGGGCELALACDIRLASTRAKLGQPEINLGVIPGAGGTQRLTRAVGKSKAMEMVLTGRMMDAQEAERANLVARVVPASEVVAEAVKVGQRIAALSAPAVAIAKEAVNRAFEVTLSEGVRFERRVFHALFATEDQKEGMAAFAEKRKPAFRGA